MTSPRFRVVTGEEHPDLRGLSREIIPPAWPEFMLHDPVAQGLEDCYRKLPQYQFALIDDASGGTVVAMANSIPLCWQGDIDDLPDDGWDWALSRGLDDLATGRKPNLLCALQIVVPKQFKG